MQIKLFRCLDLLFLCTVLNFLSGVYYFNDFTNTLGGEWSNDLRYGQAGLFTNENNLDENSVIQTSGGELVFTGSPHIKALNVNEYEFNGTWIGNGVMLTNEYSASSSHPFGFDIKRTKASFGHSRSGQDRFQTELTVWLIQQEKLIAEWQKFVNMFMLFDNAQTTSGNYTRFGSYQGAPAFLDLRQSSNARNRIIDISSNYGAGESINSYYEYDATPVTNTNHYIIRITHDGSVIRSYINPDPDDTDPDLPNEFCMILAEPVTWQSNMVIYLNHAVRGRDDYDTYAAYDYLLIRSVARDSTGFLLPEAGIGAFALYNRTLTGENDSGFNTLTLTFPQPPALQDIPRLTVNGTSVKIINTHPDSCLACLNDTAGRDTETHAFYKTCGKKIIFILDRFIKAASGSSAVQTVVRFKTGNNWHAAAAINVHINGRQFDELNYSKGKGATTGPMKVGGDFKLSAGCIVTADD